MDVRKVLDADGSEWEAYAADTEVAHDRAGAILAFRRASGAGVEEELLSTVTFNSRTAAEQALHTMSDKEIGRRLSLARQAAGGAQLQD